MAAEPGDLSQGCCMRHLHKRRRLSADDLTIGGCTEPWELFKSFHQSHKPAYLTTVPNSSSPVSRSLLSPFAPQRISTYLNTKPETFAVTTPHALRESAAAPFESPTNTAVHVSFQMSLCSTCE